MKALGGKAEGTDENGTGGAAKGGTEGLRNKTESEDGRTNWPEKKLKKALRGGK